MRPRIAANLAVLPAFFCNAPQTWPGTARNSVNRCRDSADGSDRLSSSIHLRPAHTLLCGKSLASFRIARRGRAKRTAECVGPSMGVRRFSPPSNVQRCRTRGVGPHFGFGYEKLRQGIGRDGNLSRYAITFTSLRVWLAERRSGIWLVYS